MREHSGPGPRDDQELPPFFYDVGEFPEVELTGITDQQQARNTAALNRVIQLAHDRGIRITVGIWEHIYRGGVQGGGIAGASDAVGKRVPHLVYGVTGENLELELGSTPDTWVGIGVNS